MMTMMTLMTMMTMITMMTTKTLMTMMTIMTMLTQVPNMRYGLSGAGLSSYGDTLLITGGVGRGGILKALNRLNFI